MDRIRNHIRVRQLSLKPFFRDFDKLSLGFISQNQFRQGLEFAEIRISDAEFLVLCRKYGKPGSAHIQYPKFLRDLEMGSSDALAYNNPNNNFILVKKVNTGNLNSKEDTYEDIIKTIKAKVRSSYI
jgi:Ca2+-binding EF-hand superfamily protein